MENLVATLCGLLLLVGFFAFFAWIVRYSAREQEARSAIWRAFASRHGLTFIPAEGTWYSRHPVRIEGRLGTVPCAIDTFTVSNGKSSTTYTRLRTTAMEAMPLDARVYRETIFGALGDLVGAQDVEVGDASFDADFVVKASHDDLVRAWLYPPLRGAFARFVASGEFRYGAITYRHGQIELVWHGAEKSPAVLDAALAVAVEAASFRGVDQGAFR
jgi:hypothetical protein